MKEIRILALATALASMLAIGASVSAQAQDQTTDDSSSTTTTVIEQQTVTTPADQAAPPATMDSNSMGGSSTTTVAPSDTYSSPVSNDEGTVTDYDQSPYWGPKDWNYISEEGGVGGS